MQFLPMHQTQSPDCPTASRTLAVVGSRLPSMIGWPLQAPVIGMALKDPGYLDRYRGQTLPPPCHLYACPGPRQNFLVQAPGLMWT